ncbi:hypothetical protein K439DRAFT_1404641 [Ramaria rubella]|nr:hypothetical protein K439DRAFT_1404641 [Ramaria rubella]
MDKELTQFKSGYPLQRGSACLSCRKRKMKCDAGKPTCGQCIKANRSGDCDYDDGKSKSRTQLLQEKVATLEHRLRELESSPSTSDSSASPQLQRFHVASADRSPNFYGDAPEALYDGNSSFELKIISSDGSPTPGSPDAVWVSDSRDNNEPTRTSTPDELPWDADSLSLRPEDFLKASGRWWDSEVPPPRIQQNLLEIFLPHRHQCGFEVDVARFQASLASDEPPHPALLNAIYALACHFSLSPTLTPHEPRFVSRSLRAISIALEASDRLVHVLQASCLLAVLFFSKGRLLEGYYHAGAAARLAVGLGLHQIVTPEWITSSDASSASSRSSGSRGSPSSGSILPPPVDSIELGDRVLAFWQVYNLDRCWAVATGLPVALSDDSSPRTRIETAWPRSLEEYEVGNVSDADNGMMQYLCPQITGPQYSSRDSINALRAKAATLFERAARLASSFGASTQNADNFWVEFQTIDAAISRLYVNVPRVSTDPLPKPGSPESRVDTSIFVIHSLLHAATIQLHSPFAFKDAASQQKSVAVATLAASLIHDLDLADYAFLDPIMGTCWTSVAEALMRELIVLQASPAMEQQANTRNRQLDLVVFAMNRLGSTVPLAAYQATKVEQSRGISY